MELARLWPSDKGKKTDLWKMAWILCYDCVVKFIFSHYSEKGSFPVALVNKADSQCLL